MLDKEKIKELALANGFKLKEQADGSMDLNPYVYQFAVALERVATAELKAQVEQLQKELTLSTDQNDLLLDEFVRVKCLTDNLEIHALCERAHLRMRQRVSVIDRNFKQAEKIRALESQINDLLELIYNSAEGEICMGYKADIENMAQVAHSITGINARQLKS